MCHWHLELSGGLNRELLLSLLISSQIQGWKEAANRACVGEGEETGRKRKLLPRKLQAGSRILEDASVLGVVERRASSGRGWWDGTVGGIWDGNKRQVVGGKVLIDEMSIPLLKREGTRR